MVDGAREGLGVAEGVISGVPTRGVASAAGATEDKGSGGTTGAEATGGVALPPMLPFAEAWAMPLHTVLDLADPNTALNEPDLYGLVKVAGGSPAVRALIFSFRRQRPLCAVHVEHRVPLPSLLLTLAWHF